MKTRILWACLPALACTAVLALAVPSMAANVNLKADLKGASEVPPVDTKGTGSLTATYDAASKKLSYKGMSRASAARQRPRTFMPAKLARTAASSCR